MKSQVWRRCIQNELQSLNLLMWKSGKRTAIVDQSCQNERGDSDSRTGCVTKRRMRRIICQIVVSSIIISIPIPLAYIVYACRTVIYESDHSLHSYVA